MLEKVGEENKIIRKSGKKQTEIIYWDICYKNTLAFF